MSRERTSTAWTRNLSIVTLFLALGVLGPGRGRPEAQAAVPTEGPAFSDSVTITNPYFPVVPGAVKVFTGREDGSRATIVESHLPETREFEWEGRIVTCRIVEELKFESGVLKERDRGYYAQADDGTVWSFGQTEDDDDTDDEDDDESNGWIVGQRIETDPELLDTGASPTVWMPGSPEAGDSWVTEINLAPHTESRTVTNASTRVRVHAGRFQGSLRIREAEDDTGESWNAWFAPGQGRVKTRGGGQRLQLAASSIRSR